MVDGHECYVLQVRPRQVFPGQRLFEGILWIRAVPAIFKWSSENLFPRFTTIRARIGGRWWFPVYTFADDVLGFRTGPVRLRMTIRYSDYKRFTAESTIHFSGPARQKQ